MYDGEDQVYYSSDKHAQRDFFGELQQVRSYITIVVIDAAFILSVGVSTQYRTTFRTYGCGLSRIVIEKLRARVI